METAMTDPGFGAVPFSASTVRQVMTPGVISCPPETPLRTVARMMASYRVHAVVVFGEDGWSIVSDLDVVGAAAAVDDRTAGSTAASPLVTVAPEETLERAAQLMAEHESSHLVVYDEGAERPIGVISTLDVARALAIEPLRREIGFAG